MERPGGEPTRVFSTLVETPGDCNTLQCCEDMRRGEPFETDIAPGRFRFKRNHSENTTETIIVFMPELNGQANF